MRVHHAPYENDSSLSEWIARTGIKDSTSLLIQVYTHTKSLTFIQHLLEQLRSRFPECVMIGCTSYGEILDGEILQDSTILSFMEFEATTLRTVFLPFEEGSTGTGLGRSMGRGLYAGTDTKAILAFTSQLPDMEGFLAGLEEEAPSVLLSGGISSSVEGNSYLFTRDGITREGAVGVSFSGPALSVHNAYCLNWREIGRSFTVTHAEGDRVYTIDHMSIAELYSKYLGDGIASNLLQKSDQFPLLLHRNGIQIGRDVLAFHEDGSVTVSGNLFNGEIVRFGFGDPEIIINDSAKMLERLLGLPAESVLIFSCEARRKFLFDTIHLEVRPLQEIGPAFGFFTRGEFYHRNGRNMLLNHSLTLLVLSETGEAGMPKALAVPEFQAEQTREIDTIKALWHLAQVSTEELLQLNASLKLSEQRYKSLAQYNPDIVYSIDRNGCFLLRNRAFNAILGYPEAESPASLLDLVEPQERRRVAEAIDEAAKGSARTFEVSLLHRNESRVPFMVTQFPIVVDREIVGVYGIAKNVAEYKEAQRQITHMAYHDVLTGLPNRNMFYRRLGEYLTRCTAEGSCKLAILFIDLDNFKDINDLYGHFSGDRILQLLADELHKYLKGRGIAARFGGDEFAIALENCGAEEAEALSRQILKFLEVPLIFDGEEFLISPSIGISLYPKDGEDPENLLKNADLAMYRAKQSGKNRYQFFNQQLSEHTRERRKLITDLKRAVQKEELTVYYQPLMELKTGELIGMEALVRWFHPELGSIPPSRFIPEAEENGLIDALGYQVLKRACEQHKSWTDRYGFPRTVSVNVSYRQFQQTDFARLVQGVLEETGLRPDCLNLEITESTALINLKHTKLQLARLQKLGVSISMDDFGTGYSSLSCVKDLRMDKLKIDRSFMTNISTDERDAAIVKTIIALSRNLNMRVLAEGVETKEQLDKLLEFDCDEAQGYLFSPPLPPAEFERKYLMEKISEE